MAPADLDLLRSHGFDDRAIHDATQVIAYFNYINRIADALGVEPETFVRKWEQSPEPDAEKD
jgi:alkylhydroperoxidase family enzyme